MPKSKPHAYALLIGVNDYAAYDASANLEAGTSDLHGAMHDVRQYWRMARALGIPAANIRVAGAPGDGEAFDASTLSGDSDAAQVTGASLAEIKAGLTWLTSKLDTSGVSAGMISISSHGSYDADRGSLICASDTRLDGDRLTGALPMSALFSRLAGRPQETPVTVFLDACDAGRGANAQGDRGRALRGGMAGVRKQHALKRRSDDLVLAASAPGSESYEISVDDTVRGAFSWAALAVLERWGIHRTATDTHFDITYGDLRLRVDALLKAMHVEQTAHFDAQAGQAARKVFAELRGIESGTPDRPAFSGGREISPGTNGHILEYKVMKGTSSTHRATICVPGEDCEKYGWEKGKMYWFNNSSAWKSFKDALYWNSMTIEAASSHEAETYSTHSPSAADEVYATGDLWTSSLLGSPASGSTYGSFTVGSINGYIIAESTDAVTWLLDADPGATYLVDESNGLYIEKESSAPASGSYFQSQD